MNEVNAHAHFLTWRGAPSATDILKELDGSVELHLGVAVGTTHYDALVKGNPQICQSKCRLHVSQF